MFATSILLGVLVLPIYMFVRKDKDTKTEEASSKPDEGFFQTLKKLPVLATALCMASSLMCLTFKEPLLQIRLKELPVFVIGFIFSLDTITYTLTSFCLNFIPEKDKDFKKLVAWGTCMYVFAMFGSPE